MSYRLEIIPAFTGIRWVGPFELLSQAQNAQEAEERKLPDDCDNRPFLSIHAGNCRGIRDGCCGDDDCVGGSCTNCGAKTKAPGSNGFCGACERDYTPGDQSAEIA